MAETVKKPRAAAKSKPNGAAEEKSPKVNAKKSPASSGPVPINSAMSGATDGAHPSHDQISELARKFWAERGYTDGHHEEDWFRAEQHLRAKAS